jgi:DNA polymerase I-like protein with 3'-5' exonuclease and polymerase domains
MEIDKRLTDIQSCIVNTVHDSIVIDVHPNEIDVVNKIIEDVNENIVPMINLQYKIDFNVPLLLESKIGDNWLDTK